MIAHTALISLTRNNKDHPPAYQVSTGECFHTVSNQASFVVGN